MPQNLGLLMRAGGESDKRAMGRCAMRKSMAKATGETTKKRAPSADGALRKWWQTDEGGGYAVCQWTLAEGGGFGSSPCRGSAGPREEGAVRLLSDRLNMRLAGDSHNAGADMSAMRHVQGRSACLTHLCCAKASAEG